ncbi:IS110 family transposase [Streptomyces sp. NPDC005708]|uniref:IS110 family transposase n=1 Tax=Streptomyces sp. NPDC005708 TaxID=3154564 RepID=UPI00340CFFC5
MLEITGISHVSAAVLLAEIGDINRFTSSAKLARYTGTAPIPVHSSDKERYRLHRGGNRRLNSVLYTTSIVQQRFHPGAQALLARHEPTKGARGARLVLKRHLIDVIHRAMTRDRASWQHHITSISSPLDIEASTACCGTTSRLVWGVAVFVIGLAARNVPQDAGQADSSTSCRPQGLALFGCVDLPGIRSRLDSTEA